MMDITALSCRLKELRTEHQLSQSQIGDYLHLTKQGYCHYERGTRVPDLHILQELAKLYNITLETLLEGTIPDFKASTKAVGLAEEPSHASKASIKPLTSQQQQFLNLFEQLPPTEQEDFLDFLSIVRRKHLR